MQACACTPRHENETPESHFLIKDILLSSLYVFSNSLTEWSAGAGVIVFFPSPL